MELAFAISMLAFAPAGNMTAITAEVRVCLTPASDIDTSLRIGMNLTHMGAAEATPAGAEKAALQLARQIVQPEPALAFLQAWRQQELHLAAQPLEP